jgi:hypothetical protein
MSAHQLYQSETPSRWEVEARLLAGQTDNEIALSTGLPPAVVAAFERFFFDVRDRLAAGDYILFGVIGYDVVGGFREGDLRTLWAYFAYSAGPKFFELVQAVSQDRSLPAWVAEQAPDAAAVDRLITVIKATISVSTGALSLSKLRKLLVLRQQMSEIERNRGSNTCLTAANVPAGTDCCDFGDLVVVVTAPPPADSRESTPLEREFAAVA